MHRIGLPSANRCTGYVGYLTGTVNSSTSMFSFLIHHIVDRNPIHQTLPFTKARLHRRSRIYSGTFQFHPRMLPDGTLHTLGSYTAHRPPLHIPDVEMPPITCRSTSTCGTPELYHTARTAERNSYRSLRQSIHNQHHPNNLPSFTPTTNR